MYINIFSYTNTNFYLNSHWDCFSLFYFFFYWFMNGNIFFFKYVHDSRKSFLELQQSNNLKKNNLRYFESVYMHEQEYNKYHTRMKWQKDWTYIRAYTLPHPSPPLSKKKTQTSHIQMNTKTVSTMNIRLSRSSRIILAREKKMLYNSLRTACPFDKKISILLYNYLDYCVMMVCHLRLLHVQVFSLLYRKLSKAIMLSWVLSTWFILNMNILYKKSHIEIVSHIFQNNDEWIDLL